MSTTGTSCAGLGAHSRVSMTDAQPAAPTPVDRDALARELEETRTAYHALLNSLAPEDWNKKSANPAWNVRQLMWHVTWGTAYVPRFVEESRRGKAFRPPQLIFNAVNPLITRLGSRSASAASLAAKYDAVHTAILAKLKEVRDDEWQNGVATYGQFNTVENAFRLASRHFAEHRADILKGLGRG